MWQALGATIDCLHALAMVVWILGLPLLFVRRWPRLTIGYGIYAISFIALSQGSQLILGECFMTSLARLAWQKSSSPVDVTEWFSVRLAQDVFHLSPSRRVISRIGEALIVATTLGALLSIHHHKSERRLQTP
jgi:hypothetical protein